MTLEEALKKESIGEEELKIISANMDLLSDSDLIRLGFKQSTDTHVEEEVPVIEKPKRAKKINN